MKVSTAIGHVLSLIIGAAISYGGALVAFDLAFSWRGAGGAALIALGLVWLVSKTIELSPPRGG